MKKLFLIAVFLLIASSLCFSQQNSKFEFQAGAGLGFLIGGEQRDFFRSTLSPVPDSFSALGLNASIKYFFLDNIGIEIGGEFLSFSAQKSGMNSLDVLSLKQVKVGVAGRFPLMESGDVTLLANVGAGANYNFLNFADDYVSLLFTYGYTLNDIKPSFGYYVYVGLQEYLTSTFYLGINCEYSYTKGVIGVSPLVFDGKNIVIPVYLGVRF